MAEITESYRITILGNEGGLNPGNGEAFTYRGVDESQNPKWAGFPICHDVWNKVKPSVSSANKLLNNNTDLQKMVVDFYVSNYWNTMQLSLVSDQQIANNLFDCSVNPCIDTAAKVMQKACNAAIINTGSKQPQLLVDGQIGSKTITVINSLDPEHVFNAINTIRAANYHERVILSPKMLQWLNVWLKRLIKYQA